MLAGIGLAASILVAPPGASAQAAATNPLPPSAPANLRCAGLNDPGSPPGDPSQYQLQWSWQWQTLISNVSGLRGLALDPQCNIYIASTDDNTVRKYALDGTLVAQWGGEGNTTGQLAWRPFDGLTVDASGNVFVGDAGRIQEFSPAGKVTRVWATQDPCSKAGVPCQITPNDADLGGNFMLAVDGGGTLDIATIWGGLRRYSANGPLQKSFAPIAPEVAVNGVGLDQSGNIYVTEGGGAADIHRISKLSPDGNVLLQVGTRGQGPGQFRTPMGIAVDSSGNIYVAEADNDRVQELTPSGEPTQMWGDPGQFSNPLELTVDGRGEIFVDDNYNNRVQVYEATPQWVPLNPPDSSSG
jgi:sugar lactone lactonase YvrE